MTPGTIDLKIVNDRLEMVRSALAELRRLPQDSLEVFTSVAGTSGRPTRYSGEPSRRCSILQGICSPRPTAAGASNTGMWRAWRGNTR